MARRSATNARYQKFQEPPGQTRKSAASAKPKRSSGSAPSTSKSKSGKTASAAGRRAIMVNPTTPEFKALRRTWWILLLVGMVLTTASWAVREYLPSPWALQASYGVLGLAYAAIFYALFLDWTKMRPMRQAAFKAGAAKPVKSAKPSKAVAEKTSAKTGAEKTAADDSAAK